VHKGDDVISIFTPSTKIYDIIIQFDEKMLPTGDRMAQRSDMKVKRFCKKSKVSTAILPIVDFNPIQIYLQELEVVFLIIFDMIKLDSGTLWQCGDVLLQYARRWLQYASVWHVATGHSID
jgi:hypothetical protein